MSEKLSAALNQLEKSRAAALEAALGDRAYRTLALFDADGPIQRAVNKARRMTGDAPAASKSKK